MVVHTCNPGLKGRELRRSQVPGQPEIHSENFSLKNERQREGRKKQGREAERTMLITLATL